MGRFFIERGAPRRNVARAISDLDELALRAQSCQRAADQLVRTMMPLLNKHAGRSAKRNAVEVDDAVQEAAIGMLEALKRWRPEKGAGFWTYASYWIQVYAGRCGMERRKEGHRSVEVREFNRTHASLNEPVGKKSKKGNSQVDLELVEIIRDPEDPVEHLETRERTRRLKKALRHLPKKERETIRQVMLGVTKVEIGERFGCTKQYVDRLQKQAIERLAPILAEAA